jgi:hypothetical protein
LIEGELHRPAAAYIVWNLLKGGSP